MKKLGIIGAMQEEVESLLEVMTERRSTERGGSVFHAGKLKGLDAVVVMCGIGKVNAALCAQMLCDLYQVTHIVNTGVAGSLSSALDIGDLVVSCDAMYHDLDCTALGFPKGQIPGWELCSFPADEALIQCALAAADAVHPGHTCVGRVASGDQFISGAEQKEEIIALTGALCTEMEGAAIAHTAYRNAVPFVILRAISDKADGSAGGMDFPTFEKIAAHRCAQVTLEMAALLAER